MKQMNEYIIQLEEELRKNNKEEAFITACCTYARKLLEKNKPVLFDADHVDKVLRMEGIKRDGYHTFNAGTRKKARIIEAPSVSIKKRQRWIVKNILEGEELGGWIHGYVKGRSIVSNAKVHAGKKRILRLDIKNFFPSITQGMVEKIFSAMGYSSSAAGELAAICTFSADMLYRAGEKTEEEEEAEEYAYLPHGAPSSPYLANLIFQNTDLEILKSLQGREIRYSRYADDMFFSSDTEALQQLDEEIEGILSKHGFRLNKNKTKLMTEKDQKLVMGLNITDGIRVQNLYKRKLRQEIYYCNKYGIRDHLERTGNKGKSNFMGYLYGKAYFVNMVEPAEGKRLLEELDRLFADEQ